jgi:hypothetical protein
VLVGGAGRRGQQSPAVSAAVKLLTRERKKHCRWQDREHDGICADKRPAVILDAELLLCGHWQCTKCVGTTVFRLQCG